MKFRPLNDNLHVRVHAKKKTTPGGIVLPESVTMERHECGTVLGIGPDVQDVSPGDTVLFLYYEGFKVEIPGDAVHDTIVIPIEKVLGVVAT